MANPKDSTEIWILNGVICTQNAQREVVQKNIQIIDGRIVAITNNLPPSASKKLKIIDADGLTILPGFVQAHIHLCQTLFRNQADDLELMDWLSKRIWKMEAAHTPQTLRTSALLGIYELLSSGTTCILDMGTVRHTEEIYEAVKSSGIRANVGKCLMDHPKETPPDLRETTEKALEEAITLFDRWNGRENDRIRASYAPRFVISCTEELLLEVGKLSHNQGALIHTHASENKKEIEIVKKRVKCENVEYLHQIGLTSSKLVLAHCVWLKEKEKKLLLRTGTHVVHCPSSNMKLASGLADVPEMRARGINVALGADGAPCNNNLNMFQEMRLAALLHKPGSGPKSMRAQEVLDMATRDGAKALSWFDDIGSIEVGKKADLIGLDLNGPLNTVWERDTLSSEAIASSVVYSSGPQNLRFTLVDGKMVFNEGKCLTIPREDLAKELKVAQRFMAKKVSLKRLF